MNKHVIFAAAVILVVGVAAAQSMRADGVPSEPMALGQMVSPFELMQKARWKGNVRELDNALQRAVILGEGPLITPADLPPDLAPAADDPALVEDLGEALVFKHMVDTGAEPTGERLAEIVDRHGRPWTA